MASLLVEAVPQGGDLKKKAVFANMTVKESTDFNFTHDVMTADLVTVTPGDNPGTITINEGKREWITFFVGTPPETMVPIEVYKETPK